MAGALEALLFVTDEPVGTIALADMLEVEPADVERALRYCRHAGLEQPLPRNAYGSTPTSDAILRDAHDR